MFGYNIYGTIIDCYTTCNVYAAKGDAGGLVGVNLDYGMIISCHSSSDVTAEEYYSYAGGLVGTRIAARSGTAARPGRRSRLLNPPPRQASSMPLTPES